MMSDFRGGGGSSKSGENGTRGVGRRAKIRSPIFQEFLPLFLVDFKILKKIKKLVSDLDQMISSRFSPYLG